ncbi:hypothetical protein LTR08_007558 [Meristemomyces frigidus]|nr:hypothetical protein LTR08_007558 [Meristemomyces frigidus]
MSDPTTTLGQDPGADPTRAPTLVENMKSAISSPVANPWQDRRGMFQRGREVHEPGNPVPANRRTSGAGLSDAVRRSSTSSDDDLKKTTSNSSTGNPNSPSDQRRRSSNTGGLYGNLNQLKRGSQDYGERRSSHSDHMPTGMLSGWYNSTFRGMAGSKAPADEMQQKKRSGLMESE